MHYVWLIINNGYISWINGRIQCTSYHCDLETDNRNSGLRAIEQAEIQTKTLLNRQSHTPIQIKKINVTLYMLFSRLWIPATLKLNVISRKNEKMRVPIIHGQELGYQTLHVLIRVGQVQLDEFFVEYPRNSSGHQ